MFPLFGIRKDFSFTLDDLEKAYQQLELEEESQNILYNTQNHKSIMPRNVEIKAHVSNVEELHKRAKELSNSEGEILKQEDTFYNSPQGRLKLRVIKGVKEELIYYERPDQDGPKCSDFIKIEGKDGQLGGDMNKLLTRCMGTKGKVKKTRTLYMVGQTRVHVDSVDGLGNFMELEVMLNDDQTIEEGEKIANDLQQKLGVTKDDLCSEAYMDMILKK